MRYLSDDTPGWQLSSDRLLVFAACPTLSVLGYCCLVCPFTIDDTGCPTSQSVSPSKTPSGSEQSGHGTPVLPERKTKVKRVRVMADWNVEPRSTQRHKRELRSAMKARGKDESQIDLQQQQLNKGLKIHENYLIALMFTFNCMCKQMHVIQIHSKFLWLQTSFNGNWIILPAVCVSLVSWHLFILKLNLFSLNLGKDGLKKTLLIINQKSKEADWFGKKVWELSQLGWLVGGYYTEGMCTHAQFTRTWVQNHLVLNTFCHIYHGRE